ncbi:electron transfer flavoprotein subunit beta/FixA family protein [Alicyclobacillus fastidiosus]|uniref:Electron transfer flavoprotein subunit beta n=1 Tax=Alicyclobacillus fastidiosus TaxID=392011 RepID=A0ABY6ZDC6_9BACL|nr:electron transfer flavoprotein subunit beta/FixA family protein [Alicyclobacillus fastidiosus]WAH40827.1 electron transfer flavoprotein subunit beta/FixA family protein [Alicyclobacillus fastidiosus]GMA62310.1 electron transfer flavoprotein subunit beta [Alicyclobacillus fastidiosus]
MNILVLLKQTFDTEERIAIVDGKVKEDGVRFVVNPYDEYAIEEAIRIKEAGDAQVTVVSLGPERAEEALRTALAMGADEAILADDPALFGDEFTAAQVLAAIAKRGQYDLILAGNQAVDDGSSQVAVRLAELLGWAHISTLTKLEVNGDEVVGHRDAEGDEEVVVGRLPMVVTAQQGLNDPRYPSLIGIRKAGKKPLTHLTLADLGLGAGDIAAKTEVVETFLPAKKEAGKILQGDLADQVRELVGALRTVEKVIE